MTLVIALFACTNKDGTPPPLKGDSDPVVDTDSDPPEECLAAPASFLPKDGEDAAYYRDPLQVTFTTPVPGAEFALRTTDDGEAHEPTLLPEWNASNEQAELTVQGYLQPERDYALDVTVCDELYTNTFRTSEYGAPLTATQEELTGRTYLVELSSVDFTEPAGFGAFLGTFLDVPILIGVTDIDPDGTSLDLMGAQGRLKNDGTYTQKHTQTLDDGLKYWVPTWPFEGVDFNGAPYFSGDTSAIELRYDGAFVPVHDFHLEGTFAADGSSFGGGRLWGLGDTRDMAGLFGEADDPFYVCALVEGAGAECEVCPDTGEKTCLFLRGENVTAQHLDYIELLEHDDSLYEE